MNIVKLMLLAVALLPILGMNYAISGNFVQQNYKPQNKSVRAPNLKSEAEFTMDLIKPFCRKKLFRHLKIRLEKNRTSAILTRDELSLLYGSYFAKEALDNKTVQMAFKEFIDPSVDQDIIQAWLISDPILGPSERKFLTVALMIYEQKLAKKLAQASRQRHEAKGEQVEDFKRKYKEATCEWEFLSVILAKIIGFPANFQNFTMLMVSELYRDRIGNLELAHLSKDWVAVHKILVSTFKNNMILNSDVELNKSYNILTSMNTDKLKLSDIEDINKLAHGLILDSRRALAEQAIPKIMESDATDGLNSKQIRDLTIKLSAPYRGHYLTSINLSNLKSIYHDDNRIVEILSKSSFNEKDRARLRFKLLGDLRTVNKEHHELLISLIYRTYMAL